MPWERLLRVTSLAICLFSLLCLQGVLANAHRKPSRYITLKPLYAKQFQLQVSEKDEGYTGQKTLEAI